MTTIPVSVNHIPYLVPVFNELTHAATSTQSSRRNYKMAVDVIVSDGVVSDINAGTLKVYPDTNGYCVFDPHRLLESYITYDPSFYNISGAQKDINTLNHYYLNMSEEYSNVIDISSVANASGNLRLNFSGTHNLVVGNRVYLNIGTSNINPQYNTYARVTIVNSTTSVTVDIPYVSTSISTTPIAYEGVEFFDSSFGANGQVLITTTNAHNFNVGDQVVLQMDNWAVAVVRLNSGTSGNVGPITINGVNVMSGTVPYTTSLANTAALVVANINANISSPDYTAYSLAGDPRIFIYSKRDVNAANFPVAVTVSGTLVVKYRTTMIQGTSQDIPSNNGGGPEITLAGWNTNYSGVWTVTAIPSTTSFQTEIPFGFNSVTGSERGTIYSLDNYKSGNLLTWPTSPEKMGFFGGVIDSYLDWTDNYEENLIKKIPANVDSAYEEKQFLTNGPKERNITLDDYEFLTLFNYAGALNVNRYVIEQFDETGTTVDLDVYGISLAPTTMSNRFVHLPIGPANLQGVGPIIGSSYRIYLANLTGFTLTRMSDYYYYNVKCYNRNLHELSNMYYTRFMWVNPWGGWDFYNFTGTSTPTLDVERYNYEQKKGVFSSTGTYNLNNMQKGSVLYNVDATDRYRLVSDFMSNATYDWVKEMLVSPDVRIQHQDPNTGIIKYIPVLLTDDSYSMAGRHNKLKQFIVNIQPAITRNRQRGSGDARNNTTGIIS